MIEKLEKRFGKMMVKREDEHTFVGMNIKFSGNGVVELKMLEYIKECIDSYVEKFNGGTTTPAKRFLFEVDETSKEKFYGRTRI